MSPQRIRRTRHVTALLKVRCKGCGHVLLVSYGWFPKPLSLVREKLGKCTFCERILEAPTGSDIKITLK